MKVSRTNVFLRKKRLIIICIIFLMIFFIGWGLFNVQGAIEILLPKLGFSAPVNPLEVNRDTYNRIPVWLTVYFTNPYPPDKLGQGIDLYVQKALDDAKLSIDVTSFDLNLPSLINALVKARQRGVIVRVVYDGKNGNLDINNGSSDNKPFDAIKTLLSANILLVDGGRLNGLMHNKMVIVDSQILFMGSWNLSYNDTYRNNNNLLQITDPKIIENYQAKFNEMFVDKRFGNKALLKLPYPSLMIDGILVETLMAPQDKVMAKLVKLVQGAKKTIHFMAYTYTADELANAMVTRSKAGVKVEGVIETRTAYQGSLLDLYYAKVQVKTDGNKYNMHHKVIIIDAEIVITGSFNFTKAANTINDDNVLILHDRNIAALFEQEYQRVFGLGEYPNP